MMETVITRVIEIIRVFMVIWVIVMEIVISRSHRVIRAIVVIWS